MLKKQINKNNQGFTIIEVMIVLAIAGLILLVVFLAVPALQRNARNTSRKTDVQALLAGVSEYLDNNSGALPTGGAMAGTNPTQLTWGGGVAGVTISTVNLGYYIKGFTTTTPANGDVYLDALNGTVGPLAAGDDWVVIATNAICDAAAQGEATSTNASDRSYVALYNIETGTNSWQSECQSS